MLFHDIHARTVEALPLVIETLQARGYRFAGWHDGGRPSAGPAGTLRARPARMYRESWAVVVGIDAYRPGPRCRYAANDARASSELLVSPLPVQAGERGPAARRAGDARGHPRRARRPARNASRVSRDDRVFVFFAGHGATRKLPSGRSLGYIVPVERRPRQLTRARRSR